MTQTQESSQSLPLMSEQAYFVIDAKALKLAGFLHFLPENGFAEQALSLIAE